MNSWRRSFKETYKIDVDDVFNLPKDWDLESSDMPKAQYRKKKNQENSIQTQPSLPDISSLKKDSQSIHRLLKLALEEVKNLKLQRELINNFLQNASEFSENMHVYLADH